MTTDLVYRHQAELNDADVRTQNSIDTGIDTGQDSPVRQELAPGTDLNEILKRHGTDVLLNRHFEYQEVDFNFDLSSALELSRMMKTEYRNLPAELRREYPDWASILVAIERGEITLKPQPEPGADDAGNPPPSPPPA